MEYFGRSTDSTLTIFGIPSDNPDKDLGDVTEEKENNEKGSQKKEEHVLYLSAEETKTYFLCACVSKAHEFV